MIFSTYNKQRRGFLLIKVKLIDLPFGVKIPVHLQMLFSGYEKITKVWNLLRPIKEAFLTE